MCILFVSCSNSKHNKLYKSNPAFYSYIIGDIKNNHILAEHGSDAYVTPASCLKTVIVNQDEIA